MNNEIKEILYNLEDAGFMYKRISPEEIKKIIDYITNLQQDLANYVNVVLHDRKVIDNYKSRIEKAVEYIQNHQLVFELSSKKAISQWFYMFYKDTLNILNGRSDKKWVNYKNTLITMEINIRYI